MPEGPPIAEAASLIGDPARANILSTLMDGKARTATELSHAAGVSPQTTSAHLAKLTEGRLLSFERSGRHRYFRLASPEVAEALEALLRVASHNGPKRHRPPGPRDEAMRAARTCYDHIAGRLGVALSDQISARGFLTENEANLSLTPAGEAFMEGFGIDLEGLRKGRRALLRPCLDWSERRHHLAGSLSAALATRCFDLGWIERVKESRTLRVTRSGEAGFEKTFGLDAHNICHART